MFFGEQQVVVSVTKDKDIWCGTPKREAGIVPVRIEYKGTRTTSTHSPNSTHDTIHPQLSVFVNVDFHFSILTLFLVYGNWICLTNITKLHFTFCSKKDHERKMGIICLCFQSLSRASKVPPPIAGDNYSPGGTFPAETWRVFF